MSIEGLDRLAVEAEKELWRWYTAKTERFPNFPHSLQSIIEQVAINMKD